MKLPSTKALDGADPMPEAEPFAEVAAPDPPKPLPRSPIGYLGALWRGEVPLTQAVWRDMVMVGTAINILTSGLSVLALMLGASTLIGVALYLSPVPYNLFLVGAVWRCAERAPFDQAWAARIGSVIWLFVAFLI